MSNRAQQAANRKITMAQRKAHKEPRRDRNGLTRCRVCGCTEVDACHPPCSWAEEDLCTTCADAALHVHHWLYSARRANWAGLRREVAKIIPF
jgi:hypothetical protein